MGHVPTLLSSSPKKWDIAVKVKCDNPGKFTILLKSCKIVLKAKYPIFKRENHGSLYRFSQLNLARSVGILMLLMIRLPTLAILV